MVPEDSSAARMPRPGATMASATRLSSVRLIESPPCFLSVKSRPLLAQPQTRWPYPAAVISLCCPHAQEPACLADLTFHLLLCTIFLLQCSIQSLPWNVEAHVGHTREQGHCANSDQRSQSCRAIAATGRRCCSRRPRGPGRQRHPPHRITSPN